MEDYTHKEKRSIPQILILIILAISINGCSSLWPFGKDKEEKDPEIAADESAAKLYRNKPIPHY